MEDKTIAWLLISVLLLSALGLGMRWAYSRGFQEGSEIGSKLLCPRCLGE